MGRVVAVIGRASLVQTALAEGLDVVWLRWPDQQSEELPVGAPTSTPGLLVAAPVVQLGDLSALAELAPRLHDRHRFDLVVSTSERGQRPTGLLNSALGLPGTTLATALAFLDKPRFRQLIAATATAPLRAETFVPVGAPPPLTPPLVVKPTAGAGSACVAILHTDAEVAAWRGLHGADDGDWMAEELATGLEYSVETVTLGPGRHELLAVTEKRLFPGSLVERQHVVPAQLAPLEEAAVTAEVRAVLDAAGLTGGIAHTEVMVADGVVRLIESHSRKGGDSIMDLVRLVTGRDPERVYCRALAHSSEVGATTSGTPAGGCATVGFLRAEPGRVTAVEGRDAAMALPGVVKLRVTVEPGDMVAPMRSSADRVGHVLVHAATRVEALEVLEKAVALVAVSTSPDTGLAPGESDPAGAFR